VQSVVLVKIPYLIKTRRLGLGVIEDFNSLKPDTQAKNIAAWTPVVADVLLGFSRFDDQAVNTHFVYFGCKFGLNQLYSLRATSQQYIHYPRNCCHEKWGLISERHSEVYWIELDGQWGFLSVRNALEFVFSYIFGYLRTLAIHLYIHSATWKFWPACPAYST
jgi:hypothetical protein